MLAIRPYASINERISTDLIFILMLKTSTLNHLMDEREGQCDLANCTREFVTKVFGRLWSLSGNVSVGFTTVSKPLFLQ